jgi:hypothetical protein
MDDGASQEEYIRRVLEAYRKTPGTMGTVRRPDRVLAVQLYQRGISVSVIENAFVLAATRRLMRPADAPPLGADSFAGLFPAGDRGSAGTARQPGLLPISPPQARTHRANPVGARPVRASARMMENQTARLRRG